MHSTLLFHSLSLALIIYAIPQPEGNSLSWLNKRALPLRELVHADNESQQQKATTAEAYLDTTTFPQQVSLS